MFHPLVSDLTGLSDQELEDKIKALTKTYFNAMRVSPSAANQVLMLLEDYKQEKANREFERQKQIKSSYNGDLDNLINIG